jgi:hypothetical protein
MDGLYRLRLIKMYKPSEDIYEDDVVWVCIKWEWDGVKHLPFIHFTYFKNPSHNHIKLVKKIIKDWKVNFKEEGNTCFFSLSKNYHFISLIDPQCTIIGEFPNPDGSGIPQDLIMWSL